MAKKTKKIIKKKAPLKKTAKKKVVKKVKKAPTKKVTKKKVVKKAAKKKVTKKKVVKKTAKKAKKAPAKKTISRKAKNLQKKAEELLVKGRQRGFVTYDEILKEFPAIEEDIIFLEELYEKFNAANIDVLESGGMLGDSSAELLEKKNTYKRGSDISSHDSIQMYLREIGQYPLLKGVEERELAKRILD